MNTRPGWQKVTLGLALALFLALGSSPPSSQAKESCEQLIQNKCSSCHFVTHICTPLERGKGNFYWKRTVETMVMSGMETTKEENKQLTDCLSQPDDKVKALCPNQ
nr:hypothetical protein [uncultured Desulfobulbus sp.]